MNQKEYISEVMEKIRNFREKSDDDWKLIMDKNIEQQRELVKHLILISSGIVGFTIPIFGRTNLIENSTLLIYGLVLLLIVILYGFFYLIKLLIKENKELHKNYKEFSNLLDPLEDDYNKYDIDPTEENFKKLMEKVFEIKNKSEGIINKKEKAKNPLIVIYSFFFFSLLGIVLSLLNIW